MDDVSSVHIGYVFQRYPKHKTDNVLAYTADLSIVIDGKLFLSIIDIAILDFSIQLYKWANSNQNDFIFIPMDDDATVLEIRDYNKLQYSVSSKWSTDKRIIVNKKDMDRAISSFLEIFERDFAKRGGNFYREVKKYT